MISTLLCLLLCGAMQNPVDPVLTDNPRYTVAQFHKMTVSQRLEIYNALYDRSGHPRNTGLAGGFGDKPAETLQRIVADLPPGDFSRFLRYMPIVQSIADVRSFDICRTREFRTLGSRMRSYRLSQQQETALRGMEFRGCSLFQGSGARHARST
jgi:hypothetical protein